jgi:hypothetical protein
MSIKIKKIELKNDILRIVMLYNNEKYSLQKKIDSEYLRFSQIAIGDLILSEIANMKKDILKRTVEK